MHVIPICLCAMLAWFVVIRSAEKTTLWIIIKSTNVGELLHKLRNRTSGNLTLLLPRILCNRNGANSHLQTEMGFLEDFRYSLYN